MKSLAILVLCLGLAGGGYYVFFEVGQQEPGGTGGGETALPEGTANAAEGARDKKSVDLKATKAPPPVRQLSDEEQRVREWTLLRPAAEQLLPDPDHIGPCPPAGIGGRPQLVVRRFRDPDNGFAVWAHDDGSYTYYHVTGPGYVDPVTGKRHAARMMVTTAVPEKVMPISPEDLAQTGARDAKKDTAPKKK